MKTISFIGVGIMGRGIVKNLKKLNLRLKLYSRNPSKILDLKDEFTTIHNTIKETMEGSDCTLLCLTEDSIIKKLFFEEGILEYSNNVIVDFGTTSPKLTLLMNIELANKKVQFIDSPMTGSKLAADAGQIIFMVGATESNSEIIKPILQSCGKKIIYTGQVGMGQKMKIVLNMIQAGLLQIYMEGFILAEKMNLDRDVLFDIISNSAAKSSLFEFKMNSIFSKNFDTNFSLKNMNKDLNHALDLIDETNSSLPLISSLKSIYNSGISHNLSEEDFCSLFKINESLNDIKN